MDEYEDYLTDALIGEQKIVTYRTLSRALNIHVQLAKEMLYAFYTTQITKRPDSIHATYLLTGYRRSSASTDTDGDELMDDTPASSEVRTILVVPQEKLDAVKTTFSRITAIHIYSLEPTPLPDLNVLAVPNHDLLSTFNPTNSPEPPNLAVHGTITNPAAKRRGKPAPLPSVPSTSKPAAPAASKKSTIQVSEPTPKSTPTDTKHPKLESQDSGASQSSTKAPAPRTKSTAQSFFGKWNAAAEKQKAKPKPAKKASPPIKKEPSPPPLLSSDSEEEEREPTPEPVHPDPHGEDAVNERAKKRSELEAMMESSPEPSPPPSPKRKRTEGIKQEDEDTKMADTQEKPETNGRRTELPRRRGRRKVMKTVNVKDEDGYLVTKQEAVWESYSEGEDEPNPVKAEKRVEEKKPEEKKPAAKKVGATKQGNLMSFFSKK